MTTIGDSSLPSPANDVAASADLYHEGGPSSDTLTKWASSFRGFDAWCCRHGKVSLPAAGINVARYLAARAAAGVGYSQLRQDHQAIRWAHTSQGLDDPCGSAEARTAVKEVLAGARTASKRSTRQACAMSAADLCLALDLDYRTPYAVLDQTIMSIAFKTNTTPRQVWEGRPVEISNDFIKVILPALSARGLRVARDETELLVPRGDGGVLDAYSHILSWAQLALEANHPVSAFGTLLSADASCNNWASEIGRRLGGFNSQSVITGPDADVHAMLRRLDQRWLMKLQMDAAVVLLFAGALRGREALHALVGDWRHGVFDHGVTLFLPSSKTDPQRRGHEIEIPYLFGGENGIRPVEIIDRWIQTAELDEHTHILTNLQGVGGDLSRLDASAAPLSHNTLLGRLSRLSVDAGLLHRLTGHSGRRGFATLAIESGVDITRVMAHTRHTRFGNFVRYVDRHSPGVHGRRVADGMLTAIGRSS